jgi:Fe2+ or Zn2+ uptake regulation protein
MKKELMPIEIRIMRLLGEFDNVKGLSKKSIHYYLRQDGERISLDGLGRILAKLRKRGYIRYNKRSKSWRLIEERS